MDSESESESEIQCNEISSTWDYIWLNNSVHNIPVLIPPLHNPPSPPVPVVAGAGGRREFSRIFLVIYTISIIALVAGFYFYQSVPDLKPSYGVVSMSLCGGLTGTDTNTPSEDSFLQNMVTYDDLVRNPKLVENPDLVVRHNGKYYNWRAACPAIMSLVIYQKPLPQATVENSTTNKHFCPEQ